MITVALTLVLFRRPNPNPIYRITTAAHVFSLAWDKKPGIDRVITETNDALAHLRRLSASRQIQYELGYLRRCSRELKSKAPLLPTDTEWDFGRLDTIAVAIGKKPLAYLPDAQVMFKRAMGFGVAFNANWHNELKLVDDPSHSPYSRFDDYLVPILTKAVRSGYYTIQHNRL